MKNFLLKYYIKTLINSAIHNVRASLFENKFENVSIISNQKSDKKLENLFLRLKYFYPDFNKNNYKFSDKISINELFSDIVIILDQNQKSPKWIKFFKNVFNVDYEKNMMDGWELCALTELHANLPNKTRTSLVRTRFNKFLENLTKQEHSKTYIFGTGLSLADALSRDFSDGYRIVCNTIVRDPELWHHLDPDIFVAGDAIYHFGFTDFACAFRADLRKRLKESNGSVLFVYPAVFDALVQREFAEFSEVLVPIPTGPHDCIEVDLRKNFALPALGNVLNCLLLPLACTLTRSVWLWGFDGRAPTDKLFWSNSSKHSYPELMHSLIEAHPAFYETLVPVNKESNYVNSVHGDALEHRLQQAEKHGFQFVMMHKSWTPTLQKRFNENS